MTVPDIRGPLPGPRSAELIERVRLLESAATATFGMSPQPMVMERGEGAAITDVDGNVFLDFVAGFGVLNTGHGHPQVLQAMQEQAARLVHIMGAINTTRTALLEALSTVTPGSGRKRILFGAAGGEAIDMAIRFVRDVTKKYEVLAFYGAYHGRGQGAMALMGRRYGRKGMQPMVAGAVHVPYPYCYRCPFGKTYPDCGLACARFIENVVKGESTGVA
ncbi:MAG: aminotransferase class III-fold pyridoxal phosphate-dependent enzyme, partial [Solimonas sp.]